jgi:signal transduction histidine kinase/CheY-like chemotaxis protein
LKKLIIFALLFSVLLEASYIRSIRIGSFPDKSTAEAYLLGVNKFISSKDDIVELEKNSIFEFKVRKSGSYFVVVAEPFVDKMKLQLVLDTLRESYKDVYVTSLKTLPKPISKKIVKKESNIIEQEEQENLQDIKIEPVIEEVQKQITPEIKKKIIDQEVIKQGKQPQKLVDANTQEEDKFYIYIIFFLFLLVVLLLIYYISKLKKKEENLITKELINNEKIFNLEKELENKSKLISYVSHELRTPMTAIMGIVHLIQKEDLSMNLKDYVSKIETSSEHLVGLINNILDMSKMESGEFKLENSEFNINDILSYVTSVNAVKARSNNTILSIDVQKGVPSKILGDSLRIGQVLINLIGNATKFTHDGEITVKVEKVDAFSDFVSLKFSVSDTGIGMTDEQVQNIFKSYYQAEDSTSRKFGGTGLGLSISQEIIQRMGGKIEVQSQKGIGTVFYFTIDLKLRDSQNKRQYRLPSAKLLNKNILIIDPSNKNVISLMSMFGYFNYTVNSAPSFDVDMDDGVEYDIIVVDQHILNNSALNKIRKLEKNTNIKLVVTSEIYSGLNNRILDSIRVDYYLEIPCTQQTILNMIVDLFVAKNINKKGKKLSVKEKLKSLKNKKILVAEDNEINQKVIAGLMASFPIEMTFVKDGQEAIDITKKSINFDLILMDINMPNINGYEATREIRKNKNYYNTPILALTGDVSTDAIKLTLDAGMQGHISKPIIVDKFYKMILDNISNDSGEKFCTQSLKNNSNVSQLQYEELSVDVGLKRCDNDVEFYKSILEEFKIMYSSSTATLTSLCSNNKFKEARKLAMDIKDVSLNIAAYNVCESAAAMEYEFEKGPRGNWKENIAMYDKMLKKLFEDISKYLQN